MLEPTKKKQKPFLKLFIKNNSLTFFLLFQTFAMAISATDDGVAILWRPIIFVGVIAICGEALPRLLRLLLPLRFMKFCSVLRRSTNGRPLLNCIKSPFTPPPPPTFTPFSGSSRTRRLLLLPCFLLRGLLKRLLRPTFEICKNERWPKSAHQIGNKKAVC